MRGRGEDAGIPLNTLAADRIVVWRWRAFAYAQPLLILLLTLGTVSLILMNLYYRGLVRQDSGRRHYRADAVNTQSRRLRKWRTEQGPHRCGPAPSRDDAGTALT